MTAQAGMAPSGRCTAWIENAMDELESLRTYLSNQPDDVWHVRLTCAEMRDRLSIDWSGEPDDREFLRAVDDAAAGAGFGVSVAAGSGDDGWIEFSRGFQRWPGVRVESSAFGSRPLHERLRGLSEGYLLSAKCLCTALGEKHSDLTWPRASVVRFCYLLAVELFLKACIVRSDGDIRDLGHEIGPLQRRYTELHPGAEYRIETPYDISLADVEQALGAPIPVETFERKPDQVYRYLSDRQGRTPKTMHSFAPGSTLAMIERFEADADRIWKSVGEESP